MITLDMKWQEQRGTSQGWYVEVWRETDEPESLELLAHSEQISFAVDVDAYPIERSVDLLIAIQEAYNDL